ncbi:FAD binding domain-containing protein [Pseudohoeflea coraliihabitans]|uniref:FAD binding domain-containing protein n=1 Tax=Pseudohoeflea coraliihabitans TaxID=2860393 RepID=A0ABS6WL30_9HYPH|nr:FAD binding domain-containing protein [Pseudohoeflea sp. DP4N28-3]MBW3096666.1 FAD binding domain-containing protein [Pseudohoeflea sp. DP4N28-3]
MKPAPFDYVRCDSLEEAAEVIAQHGDAVRVLAGGQSLMPMLNMRLSRPSVLADIMQAGDARQITADKATLRIGAGVRQTALSAYPDLCKINPLLARALPWVGHTQTRARGTVCGSVAHADPSAEIPLTLAALDGTVILRRGGKRRRVTASDFFLGMMLTDKADDEIIEAVEFPILSEGTGVGFCEVGRRKGDFAIVACAALVSPDRVRLAVGGVNDTPVIRDWDAFDPAEESDALNALAWSLDAREDLHASARYRRDLVRSLGAKALQEARTCAA